MIILRTVFRFEKLSHPRQFVLASRRFKMNFKDISGLSEVEKEKYIQTFKEDDKSRGFDLTRDMLMRVSLIRTGEDSYKLVWAYHHILMDGWCMGIIFKELIQIYISLTRGEPLHLKPVTPYKKYIQWLENQDEDEGLQYWSKYLENYEEQAVIPGTYCKEKNSKYEFKEHKLVIDDERTSGLRKIARQNQTTVNIVFQVIWGLLLQRYNNVDDVVYGVVVAGRSSQIEGIENMVGLFINAIPMRIKTNNKSRFSRVLKTIQKEAVLSKPYEYLPLAEIQSKSELKGNLLDHVFVFENFPGPEDFTGSDIAEKLGFMIEDMEVFEQTGYDFHIIAAPGKSCLIRFGYNSRIYSGEFIKNTASHFQKIIEQVVENPHEKLFKIEILTEAEKKQVLYDFNSTDTRYPADKTIDVLFAEQVKRTPDSTALTYAKKHVTYGKLNERANQLAKVLREKGVAAETIVAITVERSIEMMIGILAVLKAGGVYLPIDPGYPEERICYMLADSNARVLLSEVSEVSKLSEWNGEILHTPAASQSPLSRGGRGGPEPARVSPTHLGYTIYTSGSTGKPKGVLVEHRSVVNILLVLFKEYPLLEKDAYLLKTSCLFDVSVTELFGWFIGGGRLVIMEKDGEKDPQDILDSIERENITHINFVPSMFNAFVDIITQQNISKLSGLKYIFLAGEAILPELVKKYERLDIKIILENLYGPTEATVYASKYSLQEWDMRDTIPIGRPLGNVRLHILDGYGHLQPVGIPGELCISGVGLARGYLNRPQLTSEKFRNWHPPSIRGGQSREAPPSTIYRTGDLARWQPDRNIEFLGRIDHQVKIRGFRIEPAEIESKLLAHDKIKEAVVIAKENSSAGGMKENREKHLIAYIVSTNEFSIPELKEYLSRELPDFMIPLFFVQIEKIPVTASGKVDRKELPSPEVRCPGEYIGPGDEVEDKLVEIWSDVLEIKREIISINSNFFDLGGHSLKATILAAKIHKEFNVKTELKEIFNNPTIRELSRYIKALASEQFISIGPAEKKEYYALSSAQRRLFIQQQMNPYHTGYNMPLILLLEGAVDTAKLEGVFRRLIQRHEGLRTSFELVEGKPVQQIHKDVDFKLGYCEVDEKEARELVRDFVKPFSLNQAPLMRVKLVKTGEERYILMVDLNHIIADGFSIRILEREFTALYVDVELSDLRIQYKDFSEWQNRLFASDVIKKQENYWLEELKGEIPRLNLQLDYPGVSERSFEGSIVEQTLEKDETEALKALASEEKTTMSMLLFTIFNIFLSRLSGQEDIVVGVGVAGRKHADLQMTLGMFINMLALRNYPGKDKSFKEFMKEVKERTLKAFENQDYPFEQLVEKVAANRNLSRNPLFDVDFGMDIDLPVSQEIPRVKLPGLELKRRFEQDNVMVNSYFLLRAVEMDARILLKMQYSRELFKKETMENYLNYYRRIIQRVTEDKEIRIRDIDLATQEEKDKMLAILRKNEETLQIDFDI
ncbi:MAG: amino acid adenylation domain-containing protein [Candidatus Aminicenantes bacterium]|nr:amino acid adenylation domain-containing protein [Candidatus Aminicenantes bacterium]NIM83455.1 amino acid adenylation domain-containing protein [Candidatus Aminicenantes bacterium]NIN22847.1 amino acid adenylation domain-containing protein [Candidatus Aminicenantes bacterium]NIN46583.1 amino acid adenylation domain-containing protein [Candidatus Aminicenantes bacterium]NIN89486.1 amino acid adenylation domain-containing protein [Candidatus Aminicenantes bacterium]